MYSRNYQAGEIPSLPESYSGVAFREPEPIPDDAPKSVPRSADVKFTTSPAPPDPNLSTSVESVPKSEPETVETGGILSGIMDALPLKGLFSGLSGFNLGKLSPTKIGTEEILLIGLALFLFFSKEGDKECSLLLILLLFIH